MDMYSYIWQNKIVRFTLLALSLFVAVVIVLAYINKKPSILVVNTGITLDSHVSVLGDKLAVYNGSSFYKVDPYTKGSPQVVYTPTNRLPNVSNIVWADTNGALLNFSGGINYSPVEPYFVNHKQDQYAGNLHTWYLDFKSGELTVVDEYTIQKEQAFYSSKLGGFFYIPNIDYADIDPGRNKLRFYDIKTKKTSTVIEDFNTRVYSMQPCPNEGDVCIAGLKRNNSDRKSGVYAISKNGTEKTLLVHEGDIYSSPVPSKYILLGGIKPYQEVDILYTTVQIVDISDNTTELLNTNVFSGGITVGKRGDSLYYVDGRSSEYYTFNTSPVSKSLGTDSLILSENSNLTNGMILTNKTGDSHTVLVSSLDRFVHVLSDIPIEQTFSKKTDTDINKSINACTEGLGGSYDIDGLKIRIFVKDDDTFNDSLKAVKACVAEDPANLLSYTYTYQGVSPFNQRISTD